MKKSLDESPDVNIREEVDAKNEEQESEFIGSPLRNDVKIFDMINPNIEKRETMRNIDELMGPLIPRLLKETNSYTVENNDSIFDHFTRDKIKSVVLTALGIGEFLTTADVRETDGMVKPTYYASRIIDRDGFWGGVMVNIVAQPIYSSSRPCREPNASRSHKNVFTKWKLIFTICDTLNYYGKSDNTEYEENVKTSLAEDGVTYPSKLIGKIEASLTVGSDNVEYYVIDNDASFSEEKPIEHLGLILSNLQNRIKCRNCTKCVKCGETSFCEMVSIKHDPSLPLNISINSGKLKVPKTVTSFIRNDYGVLYDINILLEHVFSRTIH